jgi:hypothetical protein
MLKGDISNKPALSVVVLLDDIADKVYTSFLGTKVTVEINSAQQVLFLNKLCIEKDIRIIVACLMDKKYRKSVEEQLDNYHLLFSELIFMPSMDKLLEHLNATDTVLYTSNQELLGNGYKRVVDIGELSIEY